MPYRLIAIDLDDTLLGKDLVIAPRNLQAIRHAKEKGVIVTLATGRMHRSAAAVAQQIGIGGPIIAYQGASVKNVTTGEVLVHYTVPLALARDIIRVVKPYGYHINVYVNDELYMERLTEEGRRYAKLSGVEAHPVGDLREFLKADPTKVVVISGEDQIEELLQEMKPRFGAHLHVTKSKPVFLEFSHPRATKGQALAFLARYYGIDRREVMAIGDGYNDVDMVEYAGLGVVVGTARDEIKHRADYVTSSGEEGVAEAIEKFVL
ncbi:MAG: HAD family phosphatase [Peptococcaceae bacterium]|nr:HAD family phosphatase [Peptococcaceae bacterium]